VREAQDLSVVVAYERWRSNAAALAALGVPSFACTPDLFPDLFPDLMAAAIQRQDLALWAAKNDIVVARGDER
jgi:hypothetical protein